MRGIFKKLASRLEFFVFVFFHDGTIMSYRLSGLN